MNSGWVEASVCPVCGSTDLAPYKRVLSAPTMFVDFCGGTLPVETVTRYVSCSACGLVIQSPRVTDERIALYYSSGSYRETLGISVEAMDVDEKRRALDVSKWIAAHVPGKVSSHMDIGCSRAYLLGFVDAKLRNGYEPNQGYSDYFGIFSDRKQIKRKYELVTAIHVLEHTTDPLDEIRWYKSICSKNLLIEVPGANCRGGPLRFAHLFFFSPSVLISMLGRVGIKVLEVETKPNTRILAEVPP